MSTQTLFGVVAADGSIISGSGGFSSENTGAGVYSIVFDTPFSSTPAVVATQGGNFPQPSNLDGVSIGNLTPDACLIVTGDDQGNFTNRQFSLVVIGTL